MTVLVVAAHPDDEVLGVGGTLAKHAVAGETVHAFILADGLPLRHDRSDDNPLRARAQESGSILGLASVRFAGLPDQRLDMHPRHEVVDWIRAAAREVDPETVYTHHWGDVNLDHRLVCRDVLTAFRPAPGETAGRLLCFETPSSTEWHGADPAMSFVPNFFVDISETIETKIAALQQYSAELREFPHPRSEEAIRALAVWRGASAGVGAAEAFHLVRDVWG